MSNLSGYKHTLASVIITVGGIRISTTILTLLIPPTVILPLHTKHTRQRSQPSPNPQHLSKLAARLVFAWGLRAIPSSVVRPAAASVCCSSGSTVGSVMVGFDDFGAFGASVFAASAEEGDPDCSCAAEEAEKGEEDEGSDDADDDACDCSTGKAMCVVGGCTSEGDVCTCGDRGEERDGGCGRRGCCNDYQGATCGQNGGRNTRGGFGSACSCGGCTLSRREAVLVACTAYAATRRLAIVPVTADRSSWRCSSSRRSNPDRSSYTTAAHNSRSRSITTPRTSSTEFGDDVCFRLCLNPRASPVFPVTSRLRVCNSRCNCTLCLVARIGITRFSSSTAQLTRPTARVFAIASAEERVEVQASDAEFLGKEWICQCRTECESDDGQSKQWLCVEI
jgi:hypothetical protein